MRAEFLVIGASGVLAIIGIALVNPAQEFYGFSRVYFHAFTFLSVFLVVGISKVADAIRVPQIPAIAMTVIPLYFSGYY